MSYDLKDRDLLDAITAQALLLDSPFEIMAISQENESFQANTRLRSIIKECDMVIFLCGFEANKSAQMKKEFEITKDLGKKYFLLSGYPSGKITKPYGATINDSLYSWTWDNLKSLINGKR